METPSLAWATVAHLHPPAGKGVLELRGSPTPRGPGGYPRGLSFPGSTANRRGKSCSCLPMEHCVGRAEMLPASLLAPQSSRQREVEFPSNVFPFVRAMLDSVGFERGCHPLQHVAWLLCLVPLEAVRDPLRWGACSLFAVLCGLYGKVP